VAPVKKTTPALQLKTFRHLWGVEDPWEVSLPRAVEQGYSGIDTILPAENDRMQFRDLLDEHFLDSIVLIFTNGRTVDEHVDSFARGVESASRLRPVMINAHSGVDCWSYEESHRFFEKALEIERQSGIRIAHETHRGRILFNPRDTLHFLRAHADLKITADYSHWVVSCERLPFDQVEAFALAAERTLHVHARVGFEQGPQVSDPRAPEWGVHLDAHEGWWRQVISLAPCFVLCLTW
jgi:sugar phosphate isomerase/epimerase